MIYRGEAPVNHQNSGIYAHSLSSYEDSFNDVRFWLFGSLAEPAHSTTKNRTINVAMADIISTSSQAGLQIYRRRKDADSTAP
jgi:hypothetical protein